MRTAQDVNQELMRLDMELRGGSIDRAGFRALRRQLLLDFEERQTATTPGALTGNEVTLIDAPPDLPFLTQAPPSQPAPVKGASAGAIERRPSPAVLIFSAFGVVVALGIAVWWMFKPAGNSVALNQAATTAPVASPIPAAETPLAVASDLLDTEWTTADVSTFLQRWNQLAPEAVAAVSEDSRIWLLRGETDRRLRDAREAESVDQSAESQERVQQLEQVQAAIRSP